MSLTIITNNVPRFTVDAYELTPAERRDFDYLDWDAIDRGESGATFFRYRGNLYDLSEILAAPGSLAPWEGYASDSYFSGIVVRFTNDSEEVIVGRYYS